MRTLVLALIVLVVASVARAHDLVVEAEAEGRSVVARASYDGADPAGRAGFEIYSPGTASPYQSGVTDPSGWFAFVPAAPGVWRLVVDDGYGHRAEALVEWSNGGAAAADSRAPAGVAGRWRDALTGVSLIFGLVGFYLWRQAARPAPGRPDAA